MVLWENYHLARNIQDALQTLATAKGEARLIAGGTDLLLDMQQGRSPSVHTLVDVTRIPEMQSLEVRTVALENGLTQQQSSLFIGAALSLSRVVVSPLVEQHTQALHEAASLIGGPQVRNTATLGGNVAHALPAADGMIALLSLDAQAEVADLQGSQRLPLIQLFRGPGRSALDPRQQILVGFHLPLRRPGQASAFRRVMRPQGVAIAILNLSVWLQRKDDRVEDVRIAIGPAGPIPMRATAAEESLRNKPVNRQTLQKAGEALLEEARFRTSPHRATEEYRRHMAVCLLQEVFAIAWDRAREERVG
jgi:CO/xanthine dehydrogenase FAD-binding subunit